MEVNRGNIERALKCLCDNGVEKDECSVVLQALCYILFDIEIDNYLVPISDDAISVDKYKIPPSISTNNYTLFPFPKEILCKELRVGCGANYGEFVQHPVLAKHFSLIKKLSENRIFGVFHDEEDGFWIEECCDNWFTHKLSKDECLELSGLFAEIANEIDK